MSEILSWYAIAKTFWQINKKLDRDICWEAKSEFQSKRVIDNLSDVIYETDNVPELYASVGVDIQKIIELLGRTSDSFSEEDAEKFLKLYNNPLFVPVYGAMDSFADLNLALRWKKDVRETSYRDVEDGTKYKFLKVSMASIARDMNGYKNDIYQFKTELGDVISVIQVNKFISCLDIYDLVSNFRLQPHMGQSDILIPMVNITKNPTDISYLMGLSAPIETDVGLDRINITCTVNTNSIKIDGDGIKLLSEVGIRTLLLGTPACEYPLDSSDKVGEYIIMTLSRPDISIPIFVACIGKEDWIKFENPNTPA